MVTSETLVVKNLPNEFDEAEKEKFLKYFGAKEVKFTNSRSRKFNLAFARFENNTVAENVLHRLHQVDVLGYCLSVEFAKSKNTNNTFFKSEQNFIGSNDEKVNRKSYKQFIDKLSSWHIGLDFRQPVPCHLKYQYPPPNKQTLINIIKVLVTVPKFYTQVLHLMNKMNLPCPFQGEILPNIIIDSSSLNNFDFTDQNAEKTVENDKLHTSETESELSTDEEFKDQKEIIPAHCKTKKKVKINVNKLFKPTPIISSQKRKKTVLEEVFEKPSIEKEPKKIKLSNIMPTLDQVNLPAADNAEQNSSNLGFGYIHPTNKCVEPVQTQDLRNEMEEERLVKEDIVFINDSELKENRISERDRLMLPAYKNYAEGAPTCRLYIKNLAKTVTDSDLRYIYNRYLSQQTDEEPNMFDIKLMQEGRMKGQAFITFQTVEIAQKALKETNGYILKDKPLVVQFARSAVK